jgi:hypothetical protein
LLHGVFENEPFAEIVVAHPADLDGACTFGKSIRKIHFSILSSGVNINHQVVAQDRHLFPREHLAQYAPDPSRTLQDESLFPLVAWVVARYQREAFPDTFQSRIGRIKKKLRKQVAKLHDVTDILIKLSPFDEVPPDAPYHVELIFVMRDSAHADPDARVRCEQAVQAIRELLLDCEGIELDDDVLRSERDVTIQQLRSHRRWGDFDYVSFEGD